MKFFVFGLLAVGCASYPALSASERKFTVIAHRSSSGYLPEHTLPGVAMAHAFNVDFIEPDVVMTNDHVPVVLHDIHLDTTTNVAKLFPARKRADGRWYATDFTLDEIKTLRVHERTQEGSSNPVFPSRFPGSVEIFEVPTLEEEIQLVQGLNRSRGKNVGIYPELKSPAFHAKEGHQIGKVVFDLLVKYNYNTAAAPVYLQCFDPKELKAFKETFKPKFKLIQLIADNFSKEADADFAAMQTKAGLKDIATYADGIGPQIAQVLRFDRKAGAFTATNLTAWSHEFRLEVHPYTLRRDSLPPGIPSAGYLLDLLINEAKVDGVFTDFPDLIVPGR